MKSNIQIKHIIAAAALAFVPVMTSAADVSEKFAAVSAQSNAVVDYAGFDRMLEVFSVTNKERTAVDFDAMKAQGGQFVDAYTGYLEGIDPSVLNRDEQLAYWLNARNFIVLSSFAEQKRLGSLRNLRGTPAAPAGLWAEQVMTVNGEALTLTQIERIILDNYDDPNVIFAMYQGSADGPALPAQALRGQGIHQQLADAGRAYLSSKKALRIRGDKVQVSEYLDWYAADLYAGDLSLQTHLAGLLGNEKGQTIAAAGTITRKKIGSQVERHRVRQNVNVPSSGGGSYGGGS